jgi:hypothetical protein
MSNMTEIAGQHWGTLTGGDMFGAVMNVYTLGIWFYAIILLFSMSMIQLKVQNFSITCIIGIMISAAAYPFMSGLPGGATMLVTVMIALGIFIILYKLFHK